jgi:transposase
MKAYQGYQRKRTQVSDKTIIGIDPGKNRHQAVIIDSKGLTIGKSFSFAVSYTGYHQSLWQEIAKRLGTYSSDDLIFAVESSCNLWQTICHYLRNSGYEVVLVSPLFTRQSRALLGNDFSKTDPKDALLIALNAQRGHYNELRKQSDDIQSMHSLSIAYNKLRNDHNRYLGRLRSALDMFFPEFSEVITPGTKSSYYLLQKYLFPSDYLNMNIIKEAHKLEMVSRRQYGIKQLQQLQELASETIGVPSSNQEYDRLIVSGWISGLVNIEAQQKAILKQLIDLASSRKDFAILTNLAGISSETASLFLAEIGDISFFQNYKEIEKYAGYNLRLTQSGKHVGSRRISHLGNNRLRWILYRMTEETMKYIPEVRIKYLRRQIKKQIYRKNLVACIPQLLKLIFALLKENRYYQPNDERIAEMERLDAEYQIIKEERNRKHRKSQIRKNEEIRKSA